MEAFFGMKNISGGAETEISVFGSGSECEADGFCIYSESDDSDISPRERLDRINGALDRLSCNADGSDYAIASVCGVLAGRLSPIINKAIKLGYGRDKSGGAPIGKIENELLAKESDVGGDKSGSAPIGEIENELLTEESCVDGDKSCGAPSCTIS